MYEMKKLLGILFLSLFFFETSSAELFKKDKEISLDKFFNLDITSFSFDDHEKLIGSNFERWDGDPDNKGKNLSDWKKIPILVNGLKTDLRLNKFKDDELQAAIQFNADCETVLNTIPKKFIDEKNLVFINSDFSFLKMQSYYFSYDNNNNTRVNFDCMQMVGNDGSPSNPIAILLLTDKKNSKWPKIKPLTLINCKLKSAVSSLKNNKRENIEDGRILSLYLFESKKKVYRSNFITLGKTKTYNDNQIKVIEERKIDKTKKGQQLYYQEYIIDRLNGSLVVKTKIFDLGVSEMFSQIKDDRFKIDYYGDCEKSTQLKKF